MSEISIYQTESGAIEVRLEQDTVWLNQAQMVALFGRDQSVISRHVSNIFKEGELIREGNMQKMHIAHSDNPLEFFNLDAIISVGYRVKSVQGTRFRQWAIRTLREHLTQGYTLNRQRLEANARELEAALLLVRKDLQNPDLRIDAGRGLVGWRRCCRMPHWARSGASPSRRQASTTSGVNSAFAPMTPDGHEGRGVTCRRLARTRIFDRITPPSSIPGDRVRSEPPTGLTFSMNI